MGNYAEVMMKDRLPRKRINWIDVLCWFFHENEEFSKYCKKHKKVRSLNKLAYLYLLSSKGRSFIKEVRRCPDKYTLTGLTKIAHTKWIDED